MLLNGYETPKDLSAGPQTYIVTLNLTTMKNLYLSVIACAIVALGFAQNNPNLHLKLRASIGSGTYHTDFYFNDNSTSGVDRGYDAAVYNNTAPSTAIYSKLADGSYSNIDFAIQSLNTSALGSNIVVQMGMNVAQGQQVIVSIVESDLPSSIGVLLEDNVTGTSTLLNYDNYSFTPSTTLNGSNRFTLRFTAQSLSNPDKSINDLKIYSTTDSRKLYIKGKLTYPATIALYDMNGRLVLSSDLQSYSNSNQVDVSSLSTGMYVVKLNNALEQKTQKLILK